jgi:hypothetical protein
MDDIRRGLSSKVIFSDVSLVEEDGGLQLDGRKIRIGIHRTLMWIRNSNSVFSDRSGLES